jgi:hypothetical protein
MVMEVEFGVNKYSEVFHRVGPVYRRLAKFIVVDNNNNNNNMDVTLGSKGRPNNETTNDRNYLDA